MKNSIIILIVLLNEVYSESNPCPNVIQFYSNGHRNYAIITIPPPSRGLTVLNVKIAIRNPQAGKTSLKTRKSLEAVVIDMQQGRDIEYEFNFPQSRELPIVMQITANFEVICDGHRVHNLHTFSHQYNFTYPAGSTQLSTIYFHHKPHPIHPHSNYIPPSDHLTFPDSDEDEWTYNYHPTTHSPPIRYPTMTTQSPPVTHPTSRVPPTSRRPQSNDKSWMNSLPNAKICGRRPVVEQTTQLIIGGDDVKEGEFPWMVAMFHFRNSLWRYSCAGSLISDKYVITAAHCTRNQTRVLLEIGKHDVTDPYEEGYVPRLSQDIIRHPNYVSGAHDDVALILIERVKFTAKITPICLWALGSNLDGEIQKGTITGWGNTIDGESSNTPMKLDVRMVGLDTCRRSNNALQNIATDNTFCAGGQKKGPCHGDSGSGYYINYNKVWYLRGIISTSLGDDYTCNVEEFAVYADLTYYVDWMRPFLLS